MLTAGRETAEESPSSLDLARSLRAIGHPGRLEVLKSLLSGARRAEEVAAELRWPLAQSRRRLRELVRSGFVHSYPAEEGEQFHIDRRAVALLNASVVYTLISSDGAPEEAASAADRDGLEVLSLDIPSPPQACLSCQNSAFVRKTIDDLKLVLAEARQYHSRLQLLSSQVLTAHEAERKRIARELHDDTAQALTSILVRLKLLERAAQDGKVKRNVEELRDLTGSALDSVRRMAVDLRPAALDDLGLVAALHSYIEKFVQRWPVQVRFSLQGVKRRLPPSVELVLYRVIQEALANVAKHSSAQTAEVSLSRQRNVVTLSVRDDGRGFDVANVSSPDGRGLGLFGMRERLALVGGSLEIAAVPGEGTAITARVPLRGRQR